MRRPYFLSSTPILNLIGASVILLPLLLAILPLDYRIPPFTPRQLIYSSNFLPLLLTPLAIPSSFFSIASRLAQAWLITRLPPDAPLNSYGLWILIGASRMLEGFVLSRSVGWAYPSLFSHQALYECMGGLGPGIAAYLLISITGKSILASSRLVEDVSIAGLCAVLGWADGAPWTYSTAFLLSGAWILTQKVLNRKKGGHRQAAYEALPSPQPNSFSHEPLPPPPPPRLRPALLAFGVLLSPYALWKAFTPRADGPGGIFVPPFSMKQAPPYAGPPLEFLILTYPRLGDSSAENSILMTTLSSYASLLTPADQYGPSNVSLSVFTHSPQGSHPSFEYAQETYGTSEPEKRRIQFYRDGDEHSGMRTGQHLHVAEAFRWMIERKSDGPEAEWIMLIEDDFPLCGLWGWASLQRVMDVLNQGGRRGGFVGTGGSGLIIHRSLLPTLSMILRAHANLSTPSAVPFGAYRPADLIIQDCLLARDPLCALDAAQQPQYPAWAWTQPPLYHPPSTSAWKGGSRSKDVDGDGLLVISSRLIMDHRGARVSTAAGRSYGEEQWRCGWRHPFHGWDQVSAVEV